jgi:hypothetical protein
MSIKPCGLVNGFADSLLGSQRRDRIHQHRPPRGKPDGHECNKREHARPGQQRDRVTRAHAVQQVRQEGPRNRRRDETCARGDEADGGAPPEHEPSDVHPRRTERKANRDLARALPNGERERRVESDRLIERQRLLAAAAIVTLALGLGVNSAVASLAHALF